MSPELATTQLDNGKALEKFVEIIEAQNSDPRVCDDLSLLPTAKERSPVRSQTAGTILSIDARQIGVASISLGAARNQKTDVIDPAVGIEMAADVGDTVGAGDVLCWLHLNGKGVDTAIATILQPLKSGRGTSVSVHSF